MWNEVYIHELDESYLKIDSPVEGNCGYVLWQFGHEGAGQWVLVL
jgi:hypothetical protein